MLTVWSKVLKQYIEKLVIWTFHYRRLVFQLNLRNLRNFLVGREGHCSRDWDDRTLSPYQRASGKKKKKSFTVLPIILLVLGVFFFKTRKRGLWYWNIFQTTKGNSLPSVTGLIAYLPSKITQLTALKQSTKNTPTLSYLCLFCSHDPHTSPMPSPGSNLVKQR